MMWLPESVELWTAAALVGVSFFGSFITVAMGIGGGGLVLAVMAMLVPPAALIPVHGVIQLGSNTGRMAMLFRHIAWGAVPMFAVGSLAGAGAGGLIAVELPPAAVQIGVGLFVIWTVLAQAPKWFTAWPVLAGVVSSFLTMFFGATGMFVASFSKALGLPRHSYVATHATLMTLQHALKVVIFGLLGFAFGPWAALVVTMIAAGLCGTFAGRLVLDRMDEKVFGRVLNGVLVLISLRLIWQGVQAL
jgi:uncharacterized membrane protein YfcA